MLPSVKCCRSTVLVRALPHAREVAPALVLPHVAQDAARRPPPALTTVPRGIVDVFFAAVETIRKRESAGVSEPFNAVGFKESSTVLFTEEPTLTASLRGSAHTSTRCWSSCRSTWHGNHRHHDTFDRSATLAEAPELGLGAVQLPAEAG